jgi:hypothetical protein
VKEITIIDLNTPTSRKRNISNPPTLSTPNPLPQTSFIANEKLLKLDTSLQVDTLLVKRKCLEIIKHKFNKFPFEKPTFSLQNPPHIEPSEYSGIEKPKEVLKKTKLLNKNLEILVFLSENNNNNNNNSFINVQDIHNLANINTLTPTPPKILALDLQITNVTNSVPSSTPSLIHNLVIDSNAFTQATNLLIQSSISTVYSIQKDLFPTLPLSLILTEENNNNIPTNIITNSLQKTSK